MATSLHHICICHAPVMLGQGASDRSVTQLCWHPLLQPSHPSSLPLSSSRKGPLCPFCLTLKRLQDLVRQLDSIFTLSENARLAEGRVQKGDGKDNCHTRGDLPILFQHRPMLSKPEGVSIRLLPAKPSSLIVDMTAVESVIATREGCSRSIARP